MAARRCPVHGIDFDTDVVRCPVCQETTVFVASANPDRDWKQQVAELQRMRRPGAEDEVTGWRLHRLLELGIDREDAEHLAARRDFDIHALAELLKRGCPVGTAIRILA